MIYRFEDIADDLPLLPMAARRALDRAGRKLSLRGWQSLPLERRRVVVAEGAKPNVEVTAVVEAIVGAEPAAEAMKPDDETRLAAPPPGLADRIGERWAELTPLARFAIAHAVKRGDAARLDRTLAELIPDLAEKRLTHLDDEGQARMVDVGQKAITRRMARAGARVRMARETAQLLVAGQAKKGDVLAVARVAGIMAAKATPSLIPLCHGIALHRVEVTFDVDVEAGVVGVSAVAEANDRTGVEMEAMVAASLAALTIYDMLKAVQRDIAIEEVVLEEKSGGRSGHYRRGATP